ncbi:MAG: hypothetical protein NVS1B11_31620 [Terriglobales bacterium]
MPVESKIEKNQTPAPGAPARLLIGGVGYRNLRDFSLGPVLIDQWKRLDWPDGIEVEDLSYGPLAILHTLDSRPPYDAMILIAAVHRGREEGRIYAYQWNHRLPPEDEIQARVAEAIGGVIDLDNLLIVAGYFKKLPQDVTLIEVEIPEEDTWGECLSNEMDRLLPELLTQVQAEIRNRQCL